MISEALARKVINIGLSTGGDFVELFFEDTKNSSVSKKEPKTIDAATCNIVAGVGMRILKGLQSVSGFTNDLSKEGLIKLISNLSKSFEGKQTHTCAPFKKELITEFNDYKLTNVSPAFKKSLVTKAYNACKNVSEKIVKVQVSLLETNQKIMVINSDGLWKNDFRFRVRLPIMAIAFENGRMEQGFEGPGASQGYEYFDVINVEEIAKSVAETALVSLTAVDCPSKKMDVVIDNGFGGVIFHEACGHSLEATAVSKNLSVFAGKKGQKIAADCVTAYDDGTIKNAWGSNHIDDEGNPTQCNCLIKDGVLNSYLVDNQNGRRMGEKGNGACRRESYKYAPTSRMSNTFIAAGPYTVEEIIKATPNGLYCKKMGGGSVNPLTGEFNFACSEAYLIEDGKITTPVKGATLVGKGSEILLNIDMVGNNLARAQGMCGSVSGSIPTDVGQPCIRVKNMTVGGRSL